MTEVGELYEKKVKCPVCGEEFKTSKVRLSKLRLVKRDSDFLPYYEGENPVLYGVFVCPHCGYAALEENFNKINFQGRETIKKEVSSKWKERSFSGKRTIEDSIAAYKLALFCGELLENKNSELGNICIRLGWLNRLKEDKDEEERFLSLARELFSNAYYNEPLNNESMNHLTVAYLIGEISRRIGDKDEAIKWFNTVLKDPEIKNNIALEKMVREQWQIVKEE